jgi:hypothetical protein
VSVPLDRELRQYAERAAAQDDRTVAAWIRHLIADAALSLTATGGLY